MNIRWLVLLFFTLSLTACASGSESGSAKSPSYDLLVVENSVQSRFDVVLKSKDERKLCLTLEQWPSQAGQLHMGSNLARLETQQGILTAADENFGYCPGGCGILEIPPHEELKGFINYAVFGNPEEIAADKAKKLQFLVVPFICRKR